MNMGIKTAKKKSALRRLATFTAALGMLTMSSGLALMVAAGPANAAAEKYFVCKYVGTPGEDEVLKEGKNPISVAAAAIQADPIVIGSYFADAQGRSFVVAADEGQDLDRSACPGGEEPEPEVIAVDVVFTAPTCENGQPTTYEVTGDTENVKPEASLSEDGTELTVTVHAAVGYEFVGGGSTYSETAPYEEALDPNAEPCAEVQGPEEPEEPIVPEEEPTVVVAPPTQAVTPTVVSAGALPSAADLRGEQGLALLVAGMVMMVLAGGLGLVRPGGARS